MSAAGLALTMLPPMVARFWLAMLPVQLAAWVKRGKCFAMAGLLRISVKVEAAPMMMASAGLFDEAELFEIPERDELAGLQAACAESDHELGASGDGGVVVGGVGEDLQGRVEGGGGDEFVLGDV